MYVIDVIPFARSMVAGTLSYRSAAQLAEGTIVEVPLRKQRVHAIVLSSIPVREAKASIKTASYTLRASSVTKVGSLPKALMDAARETAQYHAAPLSATLAALVGEVLEDGSPKAFAKGSGYTRHEVEAPCTERIERYRAAIEKCLEAKRATLLVLPTIPEVEVFAKIFKEFDPIVLTGNTRGKKREELLKETMQNKGLIITTPSFAWTPIKDLGAIIVERVSAGTYLFPKRPYLDMRYALASLARMRDLPVYVGDFPLPLEYRANPEKALSDARLGTVNIFDAREPEQKRTTQWQALPIEMRTALIETFESDGRSLVLAARRGYAPAVICRDCGTTVKDVRGRTLSVATEKGERVLRSADGTVTTSANILCSVCNSWNLMPLGIAVERVEEEVREFLPSANIVRFDTDTIRTPAQGRKALEGAKEGSIIIATETVFSWLSPDTTFDLGIIASADTLLALPFWRARERFLRLGLLLREHAQHAIVGTRMPEESTVLGVAHPEADEFFSEENGLRKALGYPPYGTLMVFQSEGTAGALEKARDIVRAATSEYALMELPARAVAGARSRGTLILHLKNDSWPNPTLAERIASLPPSIRVLIDPESLW